MPTNVSGLLAKMRARINGYAFDLLLEDGTMLSFYYKTSLVVGCCYEFNSVEINETILQTERGAEVTILKGKKAQAIKSTIARSFTLEQLEGPTISWRQYTDHKRRHSNGATVAFTFSVVEINDRRGSIRLKVGGTGGPDLILFDTAACLFKLLYDSAEHGDMLIRNVMTSSSQSYGGETYGGVLWKLAPAELSFQTPVSVRHISKDRQSSTSHVYGTRESVRSIPQPLDPVTPRTQGTPAPIDIIAGLCEDLVGSVDDSLSRSEIPHREDDPQSVRGIIELTDASEMPMRSTETPDAHKESTGRVEHPPSLLEAVEIPGSHEGISADRFMRMMKRKNELDKMLHNVPIERARKREVYAIYGIDEVCYTDMGPPQGCRNPSKRPQM